MFFCHNYFCLSGNSLSNFDSFCNSSNLIQLNENEIPKPTFNLNFVSVDGVLIFETSTSLFLLSVSTAPSSPFSFLAKIETDPPFSFPSEITLPSNFKKPP